MPNVAGAQDARFRADLARAFSTLWDSPVTVSDTREFASCK